MVAPARTLSLSCVLLTAPALAWGQIAPVGPAAGPSSEPSLPPPAPVSQPVAPPPPPRPRPEIGSRAPAAHMFEMTMGFIAGQRAYQDLNFESRNGVAASLTQPFLAAPFTGATVMGLRYDVRMIVTFVRMTLGLDLPFTTFRSADTKASYMLDGKMASVTVQALRPYELRFGLGGEVPVSIFAPFVDLIGAAHWVDAGLAVDSEKADFRAQTFGFSLRAGVRAQVNKWFFALISGEAGLYGPVRWNAELSVGFSAGGKRF